MAFPISKQGYEALKEKIRLVKEDYEKLPAIIANARAKGDLKENAEYHAAREKQGMLKAELDKLNGDLVGSQVIDPAILAKDIVTFGKRIKIKDLDNSELMEFTIVGPAESDSHKNHVSVTSVLVKGLLGKNSGAEVSVTVPSGLKRYQILEISLGL